jgi:hypothetical protein
VRSKRETDVKSFCCRYLLPVLLGIVWTWATFVSLVKVHEAAPSVAGTGLLGSAFYDPVRFIWEAADLPIASPWHLIPLYGYYTLLTVLLWSAGRSRRWFYIALAAYGCHLATALLTMVVCGSGVIIPHVDTFYAGNDVVAFSRIARRSPGTVGLYALCLVIWHGFAVTCLLSASAVRAVLKAF